MDPKYQQDVEVKAPGEVIVPQDAENTVPEGPYSKKISPSYSIESSQSVTHGSHAKARTTVGFVILAILILAALIVGGLIVTRNSKSNVSTTASTDSDKNTQSSKSIVAIKAKTKDDFSNVCAGNRITNAVTLESIPRVVALFEESMKGSGIYSPADNYVSEKAWLSNDDSFDKINIVGCLTHDVETNTGRVCTVISADGDKKDLDLYTVEYRLTLYQAQLGKQLGTFGVKGPTTACPENPYYDESNTRIYSNPDKQKLAQAIRPFINPN